MAARVRYVFTVSVSTGLEDDGDREYSRRDAEQMILRTLTRVNRPLERLTDIDIDFVDEETYDSDDKRR